MPDRPLTGKALKRLFREWTHDYGLRRLEERGVRYEDQKPRPLDRAQDRAAKDIPKPPDPATSAGQAPASRARFQNKDQGKDLGR